MNQKRWQIRGRYVTGGKLAFPVSADDIFSAGRIAAEKMGGKAEITDILLVEGCQADRAMIRARTIAAAQDPSF